MRANFRAQRAQPPQVKRGPAQLLDYTAATLDKSLAAYRAGDHDQAYDLSVAAYLEGFELVESSLDNVDANVRKDTEKALMAYRQSLQDGCRSSRCSSAWTPPRPSSPSPPACWAAMA
jgi:high-affinity iron transporter